MTDLSPPANSPEITQDKPAGETPQAPKKKIALLGSAASSVGLAPFNKPGWEIWACSPANRSLPRVDVWFELHNPELKIREGLQEWMDWLKTKPKVFMQKKFPDYPGAVAYPLQDMLNRWGSFWWTSQLSYMMALALEEKPDTIGIYGVDMAANTEYNQQRLACQFFVQQIVGRNINLVVPPESDLLEPPPLYGYCESSRQWRKYNARMLELSERINRLNADIVAKDNEKKHLVGAMDDMEYQINHWANKTDFY